MTLAHREAGPSDGAAALLLHGYPESSYMWRHTIDSLADGGMRAVAPDLLGFGDSPVDRPHTWERHVQSIEDFRTGLGLERVALVMHDWGGLIGLWWACEHPEAVSHLVISASGFFPDGKWHGVAEAARTPGTGEEMIEGMTREGFDELLKQNGSGFDEEALDEYWTCFDGLERRHAHLDFWRSADFPKLERFDGRLAELDAPTLLLWGETDPFAFVSSAYRFQEEIPGAELVMVDGAGHFVIDDEPERCAEEIVTFLARD